MALRAAASVSGAIAHARGRRRRERHAQRAAGTSRLAAAGRWSLFPGALPTVNDDEWLKQWARQLLRRWGVLFRDLLAREAAAPSWGQLVPVLSPYGSTGRNSRRTICGGCRRRAIRRRGSRRKLRSARDAESATDFLVVAGSDPLNLAGVVTPGDRVGAKGTNALALRDGHVVAAFEGGQISFRENLAVEVGAELSAGYDEPADGFVMLETASAAVPSLKSTLAADFVWRHPPFVVKIVNRGDY